MKKRALISFAAIVLCLSQLFLLASCGAGSGVMEYEGYVIENGYYQYWLSRFKANILYSYYDIDDTPEFWASEYSEGVTTEELFTGYADDVIKKYLVCDKLSDNYGLSLSSSYISGIDKTVDELIAELADGNKSLFNTICSEYGINSTMLRDIYLMEGKYELFRSYALDKLITVSDSDKEKYVEDNYVHFTHIYISTNHRLVTDEDGKIVVDEKGEYTEPYTAEEKKAQEAKVSELREKLTLENYGECQKQYNEDTSLEEYKNGFFFSADSDYDLVVISKAMALAVGEIGEVATDYGVFFIKRLEADNDAFKEEENKDFFVNLEDEVEEYKFSEYLEEYTKNVVINEEEKKKITITNVTPCYYF